MNRPNVLLIAYSCEPGRGSEWGVSWSFVHEFARHQPVWVIAHADNRAGFEAYLANHRTAHAIHVTYVAVPRGLWWMRNAAYALHNVHYYLWQIVAARAARQLHAQVGFDVVQHISYSRWWMPSAGATLARRGVRFIFGPCVGGEEIPAGFRRSMRWQSRWREFQRWVARAIWTNDPALARCVRAADLVVVGTPTSLAGVNAYGPKRVEMLPCVMISDTRVVDEARPIRDARPPHDPTFRIVSVGGMVSFRGVDLMLRAVKKSGIERFEFVHCCGGEMLEAMRKLAIDLGIADRVRFTGETKHAENLRHVARADVLMHLVLRGSQGVVPEALALGVPVLTLDHHSMTPIIDDAVGHKIAMPEGASPEHVVDRAAKKLREWYEDRALLPAMADACVARSRELSPQYRVSIFRRWHAELLAEHTPLPMPAPARASA